MPLPTTAAGWALVLGGAAVELILLNVWVWLRRRWRIAKARDDWEFHVEHCAICRTVVGDDDGHPLCDEGRRLLRLLVRATNPGAATPAQVIPPGSVSDQERR